MDIDLKHTLKRLQDKLRNCDAFFDVKQHQGSISTDKFMNIVSIFLREVFGAELLEEKKR